MNGLFEPWKLGINFSHLLRSTLSRTISHSLTFLHDIISQKSGPCCHLHFPHFRGAAWSSIDLLDTKFTGHLLSFISSSQQYSAQLTTSSFGKYSFLLDLESPHPPILFLTVHSFGLLGVLLLHCSTSKSWRFIVPHPRLSNLVYSHSL